MYEQWWDNNQLKFEITTKDGIINTFTSWYRNGHKASEGIYKYAEPILCNSWYENGEIMVKDGNGKQIDDWFENGQKKYEGTYKDGKANGLWTYWYKGGQKKEERTYKDGELDGLYTYWHKNGQKTDERNYKDGKLVGFHKCWDMYGQMNFKGNYKNGYPDGLHTDVYADGGIRKQFYDYGELIYREEWDKYGHQFKFKDDDDPRA